MKPAINLFQSISNQGGTGKTEISRSNTFVSGAEENAVTVIVNRENLIHSRGGFLTHMNWLFATSS
ncbi:hypothetical protein OIV19_17170 [Brucella sp. HL-2]|nr:hypothetical protein [Brucella sp. HL-2]MCV9909332.1 hypothetical protein [Brucella sp. HL-2]